ncbi:MAG: LysR family transcriptional regulator, partial [Chloroflexota bacterium]
MDLHAAMRVFVAVADRNSFSAAARTLEMSTTAVSRHVSELERSLG